MLTMLVAVAIILAVAGVTLRFVSDLGRTILIAGLVVGSTWLMLASTAVLFQRGGVGLLLLVLIGASAVAVTVYRRLGAIQALAVGLGIVLATAIALV